MSLLLNEKGSFGDIKIIHHPTTKNGRIIVIAKPSTVDQEAKYIDTCDTLVKAKEIQLQDGAKLKTYYGLTQSTRGFIEYLSQYDPTIRVELPHDIQVIKIDKLPKFDKDHTQQCLAKINIFVIEEEQKTKDLLEENIEELKATKLCKYIGEIINQIDSTISRNPTVKERICLTVRGPLAEKVYEFMKYKNIQAINLNFDTISICLQHLINVNINSQTTIKEIGPSFSQLKITATSFNTNLLFKMFISSFIHTKNFINTNWKNKLIIAHALRNTKLNIDLTDEMNSVINEVENPNNEEELQYIAQNIFNTNIQELKKTVRDACYTIELQPLAGHSAIGKKSKLIYIEVLAGEIGKEKPGIPYIEAINDTLQTNT